MRRGIFHVSTGSGFGCISPHGRHEPAGSALAGQPPPACFRTRLLPALVPMRMCTHGRWSVLPDM
eukprot:6063456-Alexandrium_andersonii.AAC.1